MVKHRRNGSLFDTWSVVHFCMGVLLGWVMPAFPAIAILILWEPIEIFVLSPLLAKVNITFGYESLRNSLSDICFDLLGVAVGAELLTQVAAAPFHLF